jgi:hypothetical protein
VHNDTQPNLRINTIMTLRIRNDTQNNKTEDMIFNLMSVCMIMTLSIMTLSIMTLYIMTLNISTNNKRTLRRRTLS